MAESILPIRDEALQLAKESNPKAKNFVVESVVEEFLDGTLVVLAYTDTDSTRAECLIYTKDGQPRHFSSSTEMARFIGPFQRRSPWHSFVRSISNAGMTGMLAFIIMVTICYMTVAEPDKKIPDILANALTVILGFYFGRQGARA